MKLVAKGTIEQKIMDLQERKLKLADNVVSGENMSNINVNLDDLKEIYNQRHNKQSKNTADRK